MIYLKSLAVGLLASILYAVLVPVTKFVIVPLSLPYYMAMIVTLRSWHLLPAPNSFSGQDYTLTYKASFSPASPIFLLFAVVILVAASYWQFRHLTRRA
jgi:hypothetical protein